MLNHKDYIFNTLKITGNKDISIINNNNGEDYIFSSLTCEGGGVFKNGISIGMQNKMIPGLIFYDTENFYGFSEKYGLSLLSPHTEYVEINIPNNMFQKENIKTKLQPVQKNNSEHFQNLVETEKIENKNLNIDIEIKDVNNFYIKIPSDYSDSKFIITFDVTCIYNLDSIISHISLVFINESTKPLYFKITNDNSYFEANFENEIFKNSITKINIEVINENYFMFSKKTFTKN